MAEVRESASHRPESTGPGFIGKLFNTCIHFLLTLLEGIKDKKEDNAWYSKLRVQTQRLSLWGDSFNTKSGGLDAVIAISKRLDESVSSILCKLADTLIGLGKERHDQVQDATQRLIVIKTDVHAWRSKHDEGCSSSESDTSSSSSTEPSESVDRKIADDAITAITLYNDLLLDLVPALQNPAENYVINSESGKNARSFVNMVFDL